MKPLSRSEGTMQNDQAIEIRRVARSIAYREPKLTPQLLDSPSVPKRVSRSHANVQKEQGDYSRLEVLTVWLLIAVLAVLNCGAFYVLWSKAGGGW
jgi:hypothetical protein